MDRIPPDRLEEWLYMLEQPLPGQTKATPAMIELEGDGFMDLHTMNMAMDT